jgi:anti-sigma regulatory factor (Ser/Thr protein kinase)
MDGRLTTQTSCCVLALKPVAASVPMARNLVSGALSDWRLTELEEGAGLVASEFVSNAIRYGDDITLYLYLEGRGRLVVEVWDSSPEPPAQQDPDPYDVRGRGLQLVDAYADSWGYRIRDDRGKIIWARLVAGRPVEGDEDV